ncbi:MAG: mycofactocin-associated electron transfer flavoprotein beta subunit [Acidimicrobiales bacterium]
MSSTGTPDVVCVVCLKSVALRSSVDPLSGAVTADPRSVGASPADLAALEWALRCSDAWGVEVVALSAGGSATGTVLRDALASGASSACRVDVSETARSDGVAACLSRAIRQVVPAAQALVVCGDASIDRGSGSVPAFLAAELDAVQALGLVALEVGESPSAGLRVVRRLDGGRREVLRVRPPAVLSVEGVSARLRRAPLVRTLDAAAADIAVVQAPPGSGMPDPVEPAGVAPYSPRSHVVPPPPGPGALDRILALTGAGRERPQSRALAVGAATAADEVLAALAAWGEILPASERGSVQ